MTKISSRTALAAAIAFLPLLPACKFLDPKPNYEVNRPLAIVPQKFLHNNNEELNTWLDETCVVRITRVPLSKVFAEPVFAPMNYKVSRLPEDDPIVAINSVGMTRRQLLWAISHEYALEMTPLPGYGTNPSYIEIRGRDSVE